ncbi:MAG: competence/damage-inducible protein A [Ruminococcaceae bacterium]|nr:competence/damage-inducible protein A [Oscillospiraceae bacterium]
MNAEIIAVGYEVLSGKQCNTNAQYLSLQLNECGVEVTAQVTVGDKMNSIKSAVAEALSRSNIVVLTGGLGPTRDDITKQAVCELLGIKLTVDEESLEKIEAFFKNKGVQMTDNNIRQAMVPEGCVIAKNDVGLSPGCILKSGNQCIVMLPGPPSEMCPMFEKGVKPFIKAMSGMHSFSQTVNVFGMGESLIANVLDDMVVKPSPRIATYSDGGKIDICVSATAEDEYAAQRAVEQSVDEIKRRLGDSVYGVDTDSMQQAVVSQLVSKKLTIAVAESCTGGLLSKKITDISGASLCFGLGTVSYSEDAKKSVLNVSEETLKENGAVSAETACQMAVGAMNKAESDMGVAITGYAGPASSVGEQVGLVFISVCNGETVWVKRYELAPKGNESREKIRETASLYALDMIRRVLMGAAIFNCQRIPVSEISNSEQSREAFKGHLLYRSSEIYNEEEEPETQPETEKKGDDSIKNGFKNLVQNLLPNRKDLLGEKIRKSVFLTASVALIISLCYILNFFLGIQQNKNMYNDLAQLKTETPADTTTYPEGYLEQFGLLYNENKDVAGWIEIEGSQINYPVVKGSDNDYYLTHNFYNKKERHGVPFMDFRNDVKELDFNTILHGHNMKSDNQMFSDLSKYYKGKQAITFYRKNPIISFDTVYEEMDWKIFAVFTCSVNTKSDKYFNYYNVLNPASNEEFETFISDIRERSIFNIPVDVQATDKILTLSTCYYEYSDQRLVVMARKVRDGESTVVDVNSATHNKNDDQQENTSSGDDTSIIIPDTSSRPSYNNSSSSGRPDSSSANSSSAQSESSSEMQTSSDTSSGLGSSEAQTSSDDQTSSDAETSSDAQTSSESQTSSEGTASEETPSQDETSSEAQTSSQEEASSEQNTQSSVE